MRLNISLQKYIQNIRILALVLLLFFLRAEGQVLQWSNPVKLKGAAVYSRVLGENQSGIYVLRYRNQFYGKNVTIDRYNHRMVVEQSLMVDLKNARLIQIYMTPNGLLVIKAKYAEVRGEHDIMAQWYSYDFKRIGESSVLLSVPSNEMGDQGDLRIRVSDDLQTLSLLSIVERDASNILLNHSLFDMNLRKLSSTRVELPYSLASFVIPDFLVCNNQEVFFLASVSEKGRRKEKVEAQLLFHLKDSTMNNYTLSDSLSLKSK